MSKKGEQLLSEAVDTFIEGAGEISSALLGVVNKSGGQIYALLFLSSDPLSLDDIAEKLCVSKGNVSMNVRMLEDYNLVRKVWVKGSRKDYYAAERVYPRKVLREFLEKIQSNITQAITTIERTRSKIMEAELADGASVKEKSNFMLEKLDLISLFYYAAQKILGDFFSGNEIDTKLLQRAVLNPEEFSVKGGRK